MNEENQSDWADKIGRRVSAIFVTGLLAMFAYAYLAPNLFG